MLRKFNQCIAILVCIFALSCQRPADNKIRIGLIAELTGDMPAVGASCANAAKMAVEAVNQKGGIDFQGRSLPIDLLIEDNAGRAEQAVAVAQKLISQDQILALIGPNASRYAIPVTEVAESAKLPMIAPWATNPKATIDARTGKPKQYVFRAGFIDPFQGRVVAKFALETIKARRAAVLYDVASDYNKGIAEVFKQTFTEQGGEVVAYEAYSTGDKDFSAQLTIIKERKPEVIFLPNYYSEVPLQIQQAKRLGLNVPILGSDSWGSEELIKLCGKDCEGYYFSTHYSADNPSPAAAQFIAEYQVKYGVRPDDVAALTFDSMNILFQGIRTATSLTRQGVRDAIASISDYSGVTGRMQYQGTGDPLKSAVIVQIRDGKFAFYANALP